MERILKARKTHECCLCEAPIEKGELHEWTKTRFPKYDDDDNQNGIEYAQWRNHINCPEGAKKRWQDEGEQDERKQDAGAPTEEIWKRDCLPF